MTATQAIIGYGTKFSVEATLGLGDFVDFGEVTNVTPPNQKVDQIDVTHMQSPDRTREFIQGLTDPGDITIALNHIPGSVTDDFIIAWRASGEARAVKITYPNLVTDTFPAFILGYTPQMAVAGAITASLNMKVAGAITRG